MSFLVGRYSTPPSDFTLSEEFLRDLFLPSEVMTSPVLRNAGCPAHCLRASWRRVE